MTTPINLRTLYGDRFRIRHDEAATTWTDKRNPWLMTLPGRRGIIYPFGGDLLAVEIDYHRGIARQVATIPGVTIHQDGDQEKTFLFPASLFEQVAAIVRPYKRPQLSAEQRAARAEKARGLAFARTSRKNEEYRS